MKKHAYLFILWPLLSACVTGMGDYTIAANELIADCASTEFLAGLENALKIEDAKPDPKEIADGVIVRCEDYFALLERSLIQDGKDAELAERVANDARVETQKELIETMTFN